MDEAERLCDRVALIDDGRVVAIDSPKNLAEHAGGGKQVRFLPSKPFPDHLLTELPEVKSITRDGEHVVVTGKGEFVNAVILTLAGAHVIARNVQTQTATLEDAFVRLTGRHIDEAGARISIGNHWTLFTQRTPPAAFGKVVLNEYGSRGDCLSAWFSAWVFPCCCW